MTLNVALIQETFQRAKQENGGVRTLGLRFYARLFEKYPAVRPLFNTPPEEQHIKLMAAVGAIVSSVTQPDVMRPYLRAMGIRHLQYQTEAAHYPAVQENFVAVLGEHLAREGKWTEEMKQNWELAMETISQVMLDAATHPEQYQAELSAAGYQPDGFKRNNPKPWQLTTS